MIKVDDTTITSVEVDGKQQNLWIVGDTAVFNKFSDSPSWFINGRPLSDTDNIHESYGAEDPNNVGPSSECALAMYCSLPTAFGGYTGNTLARLLIPNNAYYEIEIGCRRPVGNETNITVTVYVRKYNYNPQTSSYIIETDKTKSFSIYGFISVSADARLYITPSDGEFSDNDFSVRYIVKLKEATSDPVIYEGYCDSKAGIHISPTKYTSTKYYKNGVNVIKNGYAIKNKSGRTSNVTVAYGRTAFVPIS